MGLQVIYRQEKNQNLRIMDFSLEEVKLILDQDQKHHKNFQRLVIQLIQMKLKIQMLEIDLIQIEQFFLVVMKMIIKV